MRSDVNAHSFHFSLYLCHLLEDILKDILRFLLCFFGFFGQDGVFLQYATNEVDGIVPLP